MARYKGGGGGGGLTGTSTRPRKALSNPGLPHSELVDTAPIADVIVEAEGVKLPGGYVSYVGSGQAEGHCHRITEADLAEGHCALDPARGYYGNKFICLGQCTYVKKKGTAVVKVLAYCNVVC